MPTTTKMAVNYIKSVCVGRFVFDELLSMKLRTMDDFFAVKSATIGIRSRCVGRFNVGSGVTGIGSRTIFKQKM